MQNLFYAKILKISKLSLIRRSYAIFYHKINMDCCYNTKNKHKNSANLNHTCIYNFSVLGTYFVITKFFLEFCTYKIQILAAVLWSLNFGIKVF